MMLECSSKHKFRLVFTKIMNQDYQWSIPIVANNLKLNVMVRQ